MNLIGENVHNMNDLPFAYAYQSWSMFDWRSDGVKSLPEVNQE